MKVHLAGVGGVGMAGLAWLLKQRGFEVTGCDLHHSARTRWLESQGVRVFEGHDPRHAGDVEEIIATPALPRDLPELQGRKVVMRGEALARLVSSARDSIAVCGTHGKTTTSTWIARLLAALGENVEWVVGGETGSFPCAGFSGNPAAQDRVLVVEADESDGTLALYRASMLVVTNCEFDHPEHFSDFAEYKMCFDTARRNARETLEAAALSPADLPGGADFGFLGSLAPHNAKNALAAMIVALRRGHAVRAVADAMRPIVACLPDRRFQMLWSGPHTVVTDYAHHPTEIACAVSMARAACKGRLRVVFQPHRHSRTKAFLKSFPDAFAGSDETIVCPVYAAFAEPVEGGSSADLYAECRRRGVKGLKLARSCVEAWRHAFLEAEDGDVTLLLGAGDIIALAPVVARDMAAGRPPRAAAPRRLASLSFFRTGGRSFGGGAKMFVGAGSNLWISDLSTDAEYVRAPGSPRGPDVFGGGVAGALLGIPWMAGVPGTVGGWVKMNAGAFGHSISELVVRVKTGGRWKSREECGFGYRSSGIDGLVEEVEFLPRAGGDAAAAAEYLARRPRFPARCCGSVFKNPPGASAGALLEAAGAKGLSVGGAYVWEGHANVIAAREGATSSDILALSQIVRNRVALRLGTELEPEIAGLAP